ncbi:hypothetical protein T552_01314 [Pneumocystis carinii B80]|uniref:Protein kinase domain-containing protein n=1 Tax=Pneumocystis carinii (strain B80) TaxID=1408658 RepID=A0A0W4ZLW3_PNEC8|nr:hypothetical protein T552_01314 [Pneumocystis carinii B80]KTW29359.1 hypothetical protein T552_01314 [Pneumocystis carinii B80]
MDTSLEHLNEWDLECCTLYRYNKGEIRVKEGPGHSILRMEDIGEEIGDLSSEKEGKEGSFKEEIFEFSSKEESSSCSDEFLFEKYLNKSDERGVNESEESYSLINFGMESILENEGLKKEEKLEDESNSSSFFFSSLIDYYCVKNENKDNIFAEEMEFLDEYIGEIDKEILKCGTTSILNETNKSFSKSNNEHCLENPSRNISDSLRSSSNSSINFKKTTNSEFTQLTEIPTSFCQTVTPLSDKANISLQPKSSKTSISPKSSNFILGVSGLGSKTISPTELRSIKNTCGLSSNFVGNGASCTYAKGLPTRLSLITQDMAALDDSIPPVPPIPEGISDYQYSNIGISKTVDKISQKSGDTQRNNVNDFYTLSKKKSSIKQEKSQDDVKVVNISPSNPNIFSSSTSSKIDLIASESKSQDISRASSKTFSSSSFLPKFGFKKNKGVKKFHITSTQVPICSENLKLCFSDDHSHSNHTNSNKNAYKGQSSLYSDSKYVGVPKNLQIKSFFPKLKPSFECLSRKKSKISNPDSLLKLDISKISPASNSLDEVHKIPSKNKENIPSNENIYCSSKLCSVSQRLYNNESNRDLLQSNFGSNKLHIDDSDIIKDELNRLRLKRQRIQENRKPSDYLSDDKKSSRLGVQRKLINFDDIKLFHHLLTFYEIGEINDYMGSIYFIGRPGIKKREFSTSGDNDLGYDDSRGDYIIVIGDHIAYRYEIYSILGKGSFGQVIKCFDYKIGQIVAIKIIRNKKRFHAQALIETKILRKLSEWDPNDDYSFIKYIDHFYFRDHLCIVMELLDINLYELIRINDFRGFSLPLIRCFAKQLLQNLVFLKKHGIIHCDLKPENILLSHEIKPNIKVIDFGSSCFENERVYTYIQSRFYRSPEVILGLNYGMSIDMWSLGCILAELYTGYPIFPGEDEQEQLACIIEVLGIPGNYLIEKSSRRMLFFDSSGNPRFTVSSKGRRRYPSSKTLSQIMKCNHTYFLDFLSKCLLWDPEYRLTPEKALEHEFVTKIENI